MGPPSQEAYCCCSLLKPILYPFSAFLGGICRCYLCFSCSEVSRISLLGQHLPPEQAQQPLAQEATGLSIS